MVYRILAGVTVCCVAVGAASLSSAGQAGQDPVAPRTPWGHPDLRGTWTNATTTPMERPAEFEGREFLTEEERAVRNPGSGISTEDLTTLMPTGSYNDFWLEKGELSLRTSLLVDPSDGRYPPMTPEAVRRRGQQPSSFAQDGFESYTDFSTYDRCLTRGLPGAMSPGFYNHNYQIVQTPDYVAILVEMIHDARIVPLDGRPHLSSSVRQWMGDARGRWEGDTLVVETRNFRSLGTAHPAPNMALLEALGPQLHLVERFTRQDADTLLYQFTVNDPTAFTTPWSVEMTMTKTEDALYEYACHEGNYGLYNILAGAQAENRAAQP